VFGFDTKDVLLGAALGASLAEDQRQGDQCCCCRRQPVYVEEDYTPPPPPEPVTLRDVVTMLCVLGLVACVGLWMLSLLPESIDPFWWLRK